MNTIELRFDGDQVYDPDLMDWVDVREFAQRTWDRIEMDEDLKKALKIALPVLFESSEWNDERYLTDEQGSKLQKFYESL